MKLTSYLLIALTTVLFACSEDDQAMNAAASKDHKFSPYVDAKGQISKPHNFRKNWIHLGSWYVTSGDMSSGDENVSGDMHDVYATPESVKAFEKDGQWPDGTTLVKTVSGTDNKAMTTGNAHRSADIKVWFVMVRDRQNRFPDNQACGEGWGWALFTADDPETNLTKNWKGEGFNNCFGCHTPAKNTEWVYIEGYPTVRDAARYPKLEQQ